MDIRTSLGGSLKRFILAQFLLLGLDELHILGLRRATAQAGFFRSRIAIITFWAGPFQFYITKCFSRHFDS
jgi:hypothetical protein